MSRRALLLFAALGVAWGIPYLLIKIAIGSIDPAVVVIGRSAIGAAILLPLALARREVLPVLRQWPWLLAYTVVEIVVPWNLLSIAEQRLPSSTAGLLLAAVPLAGLAAAALSGRPERMTAGNWAGVALGTAGVAALVGLDVAGSDLGAVGLMAVVVVGYALGPRILSSRLAEVPGTGVVALSLALTAIATLPVVLLTGGWPTRPPGAPAVVSVVLLGVVCSAAAFLMLFALVGLIGPVRATLITYVNPAVAVLAGVVVLHERVTVWTAVGFVLVLGGSFLGGRRPRRAPAAPPVASPSVP